MVIRLVPAPPQRALPKSGCYWFLGVVVGDGVAAGAGVMFQISIRFFASSKHCPHEQKALTNSPFLLQDRCP
jgi:hypothetical protein